MNLIIYFTIYLIITSLLGWFANRPLSDTFEIVVKDNYTASELKYICRIISSTTIEVDKNITRLKTAMDRACDEKQN